MKNLIPPTGRRYHIHQVKKSSFCLGALVLLFLLLAACIPPSTGSSPMIVTPTPTTRPQISDPTTTLHPTVTANRSETSERTTQPTPVLPDALGLPTAGTPVAGDVPAELIEALLADLAKRLGISVDQITVIHSHAVEWSDGSLGCPQPGMMYIQVITPGFRVMLQSQSKIYDYHTDRRGGFILCGENGSPSEPIPLMPIAPHGKPPKCTQPPCP